MAYETTHPLEIYMDEQDPQNIGWGYRTYRRGDDGEWEAAEAWIAEAAA